jgi:hypothetical protein
LRKYVSSIDCNPGFLADVLKIAKKIFCGEIYNLVIDGMATKNFETIERHTQKHFGLCDFGDVVIFKPDERATEVLVFMLVSIKSKFT